MYTLPIVTCSLLACTNFELLVISNTELIQRKQNAVFRKRVSSVLVSLQLLVTCYSQGKVSGSFSSIEKQTDMLFLFHVGKQNSANYLYFLGSIIPAVEKVSDLWSNRCNVPPSLENNHVVTEK